MSETKVENPQDGSIKMTQAGKKLQPVIKDGSIAIMKDGCEPPDMLLALLNNALMSMIANNQARIMGRGMFKNGRPGTLIIIYDTQPTANGQKLVGYSVGNEEAKK